MCQRHFLKSRVCRHVQLRGVVKCSLVARHIFTPVCSNPIDNIQRVDILCDTCIAYLKNRMRVISRAQDRGWEWELKRVQQPD